MDINMNGDLKILSNVLSSLFGEDLISSEEFRKDMWNALANVSWFQISNPDIGYMFSFRSADNFITEYTRSGNSYYMCGLGYQVSEYIAEKMKKAGWDYR